MTHLAKPLKHLLIMIVGITFSAFDLLHAGHVKMLEDAKMQCDYLIAGLQTDPTVDRPEKISPYRQWSKGISSLEDVNM